jgi:hypothetical protein
VALTHDHIKRPYDVLEHHVMASDQCSGHQHLITIKRHYDIVEHRVMADKYSVASTPDHNKRPYNVFEHRVMASDKCLWPYDVLEHPVNGLKSMPIRFGALCDDLRSMLGTLMIYSTISFF